MAARDLAPIFETTTSKATRSQVVVPQCLCPSVTETFFQASSSAKCQSKVLTLKRAFKEL